ncbi:MAG: hypothetical protein ACLQDI_22975 [Syntrophobacteraceae bacterium]
MNLPPAGQKVEKSEVRRVEKITSLVTFRSSLTCKNTDGGNGGES